MKVVFMGTPDFAQESLRAIYEAGFDILAVVTNPDKPKGRGMKMIASPVKEYALEKGIKVYQPPKIRNNVEFIDTLKSLEPDVLCVVAYGKILPQEVLDIPKYGAINVHGSLLPKYRGAAPIQWAVLNGEKETGITTMFMDAGMDTGDMILKEKVSMGEEETTGELWERLSKLGAQLLVQTLEKIQNAAHEINNANSNIQEQIKLKVGAKKQGDEYTMAPMIDKEMAKIDWNKSAEEIHNLIRGLNPIMGAYTYENGKKIKIWKSKIANIETDNDSKNGEVIISDKKEGIFVKTSKGVLQLLEVQGENGKRMDIKSFLNGNQIEKGTIFDN